MSFSKLLRYNQRANRTTASLTTEHAFSENWTPSALLSDPTSIDVNIPAEISGVVPRSNESYDSVLSSLPTSSVLKMNSTESSGDDEGTDLQKLTTSWLEKIDTEMPENISKIDSNIISSPIVSQVEARFIVHTGKLRKNSTDFASSFSNSLGLSKSNGRFVFFASKKNDNSAKKNHSIDSNNGNHSLADQGRNLPLTSETIICDDIASTSAEREYEVHGPDGMFTTRIYSLEGSISSLSTSCPEDTYSEVIHINTKHIENTSSTTHSRKSSYTTSLSNIKRLFKRTSLNNHSNDSYDHTNTIADDCAVASSLNETTSSCISSASLSAMSEDEDNDRDQIIQTLYNNIDASTDLVSKKYKDLNVILGEGSGGQVKLVQRVLDNKVFALKEYRSKNKRESERKYIKKIISEFCIASTLKNPNICETLEILYENGKIFQILEYCEYDLFALVMSEKNAV